MDPCAFNMLTAKSVPHILEKIFFSLDYESFKNCMEVSNAWRSLLTSEQFQWRGKSVFGQEIQKELVQASREGNRKKVELILSRFMVDIDCVDVDGDLHETSLIAASYHGHKALVNLLLDKGANPNKADNEGYTPLHSGALWGHNDIVQLLLDRLADPNIGNNYGCTPLHLAASKGWKDVVKALIDRGADLTIAYHGNTALHMAAMNDRKEVILLLLGRGAAPNNQNNEGRTPLWLASQRGYRDVVKILTPLS